MPPVLFSSCLSLVRHCPSVQHHSQSPYKACESSRRVLEETEAILCRAVPVLLSFVCMCLFFSFSSSVKPFVLSTGSSLVSSNPFPFYRFPQELPIASLRNKEVSIPRFPHCCPHFHSMLDLLLGDAKREMSRTHLSRGSEGVHVCACLDVMCARLLFSEYQSPP